MLHSFIELSRNQIPHILTGNPKIPSRRGVYLSFCTFPNIITCLFVLMYSGEKILLFSIYLFLYFLTALILFLIPEDRIGLIQAGRVYTYFSISIFAFLLILFLMLAPFKSAMQRYEIPDLGLPISTEVILFSLFVIPLIFAYFWIKERIFQYYGKVIVSRKTEIYCGKKEYLEETLKELLRPVPEVNETDIDELYKRA